MRVSRRRIVATGVRRHGVDLERAKARLQSFPVIVEVRDELAVFFPIGAVGLEDGGDGLRLALA